MAYHGKYFKGASKDMKVQKHNEAEDRQVAYEAKKESAPSS